MQQMVYYAAATGLVAVSHGLCIYAICSMLKYKCIKCIERIRRIGVYSMTIN